MLAERGDRMNGVTHATFEEARAIVLRHGYNANACVTLMPPPFSYFTTPVIEGVIAYQRFGRMLLCGGDPICAESDIVPLTAAFQRAARRARLTIVFLPATPRAAALLTERLCFNAVK